jgi:alpha-glucosidase
LTADPHSILTLIRRLIALRRTRPVLLEGGYHRIEGEDNVLTFERTLGDEHLRVVLNFGREPIAVPVPEKRGCIVLSTTLERAGESLGSEVGLAPDEGVIIEAFR